MEDTSVGSKHISMDNKSDILQTASLEEPGADENETVSNNHISRNIPVEKRLVKFSEKQLKFMDWKVEKPDKYLTSPLGHIVFICWINTTPHLVF
jgi:hypothetical protein